MGGFSDPMVDDRETNQRYRADHLVGFFTWLSPDHPDFKRLTVEHFVMRDESGNPKATPAAVISAASLGEAVELIIGKPKSI